MTLSVAADEVVGLVGDNRDSKSTLKKAITGADTVGKGAVQRNGQDVTEVSPGERPALGIEMICQDLALAAQQDVANNIFLGRKQTKRPCGLIPDMLDKARIDAGAQRMVDRLGVKVPSSQIPMGCCRAASNRPPPSQGPRPFSPNW